MFNTKAYVIYKKCKELEAIETVVGIIADSHKNEEIVKGTPPAVTIEYLMDMHNDIEKSIWLETEHNK